MSKLFLEGFPSYLDAFTALREFCSDATDLAKAVLERHLDELATAIQKPLDHRRIQPYLNPDLFRVRVPKWDGSWHWLSVELPIEKHLVFYFGLYWDFVSGARNAGVAGHFTFSKRTFDTVWQNLKAKDKDDRLKRIEYPGSTEIGIWERFEADELISIESFDRKLDGIATEWARLWKSAGGVGRASMRRGNSEEKSDEASQNSHGI